MSSPPKQLTGPGSNAVGAVARGGMANLGGAVVSAAAQFALTLIVTRSLERADAGVFFTTTSIFLVLVVIANFGANTGLVYFLARLRAGDDQWSAHRVLRAAFGPTSIFSVLLASAAFVLADPIARQVAPDQHATAQLYVQGLALFIPLASCESLAVAASRGAGSMRPTVLLTMVGRPVVQVVCVAVALLVGTSGLLTPGWALPYLPAALAALWWMNRHVNARLASRRGAGASQHDAPTRVEPTRAEPTRHGLLRSFWAFSSARAATSIMQIAMQRLDIVLVAVLASPADAALYTAATRFVVVGQMATNALMLATQPRLAVALTRGDLHQVRDLYQVSTSWLIALAWPLYLLLMVFGSSLLAVFGPGYSEGGVVLTVVALAMLLSTAFGMVDTVLTMSGRASLNMANTAVGLGVQVALDLALIPRLGIAGAAIGWAASILVRNVLGLTMVFRVVHVLPFSRAGVATMAVAVVTCGSLPLAVEQVAGGGWLTLTTVALVAGALHLLGLLRLRRALRLDELWASVRRGRATT
ncbi:lipopolysaccharide biosynthesis protein [Terrabacter aeriphilus]|uniref:Lipopolysaccharide biosynthesis protein n=1 Tax=Terrabacter aeriphilus TaxID=515662 RepID=A0ABP9J823_9MICO